MNRQARPSTKPVQGPCAISGLVAKRMEALLMEKWQYDAQFPDHIKRLSRLEMHLIATGAVVEELSTPSSMCVYLDAIDPMPQAIR